MKKSKVLSFILAFVLLTSLISPTSARVASDVKNIIYMIPDGGGMSPFYLTDELKAAGGWDANVYPNATISTDDGMYIEKYLVGAITTRSFNKDITDSAAAGTAMSTGYKTNNGYVGIDPDLKPHANILETAQYAGKNVGMVTTYEWTNATPATFSAHDSARANYTPMSEQIVNQDIDVVLGAGFGSAKWGTIWEAEKRGYNIINTREDLNAVKPGDKLWGNLVENSFAYDIERKEHIPNIAEMTKAAITALDGDSENGFFLMVEGSKVDGGGHANSASSMVGEFLAFDEACKVALEYAQGRKDTIVVIAPDHDTGGMNLPEDMNKAVEELQKGEEPSEVTWESTQHTTRNGGLFMYVPKGVSYPEGISGKDIGTYKAYEENVIDNTAIAPYLAKLMNMNLDEVTDKLFVDVTEKGTYDADKEIFSFADSKCTIKRNASYAFVDDKVIDLDGQVALYINERFYVPQLLMDMMGQEDTGVDVGDVLYPIHSYMDIYVTDTTDKIKWDGKIYIYNFFAEKEIEGGEVKFLAPETWKDKTIKFDPIKGSDTAVIEIECPEFDMDAEDLTFDYNIITNDGRTYSFSTPFKGFAYSAYTEETITVDGIIDDAAWLNSVKMNCNKGSQVVSIEDWKGDRDLSAVFSMLWDSEYFYFYAVVTDEIFYQKEEQTKYLYKGDSVQIGIYNDIDGLLGKGKAGDMFEEITLGFSDGVPKAYRNRCQADFTTKGEITLNDNFDLKCQKSGDDLTYEMKVKWSELFGYDYEPTLGDVLGFSALINDNDGGGRRGWMEYGSGIGSAKNVNLFVTMPMLDFNKKDGIKVLLNGTELDFDVEPVFVENKILVPVRAVLESMGANVLWNNDKYIVTVETGNTVSEIPIGAAEFFVNGKSYTTEIPAQVVNGRTLVPADMLGVVGECEIVCDTKISKVTIVK